MTRLRLAVSLGDPAGIGPEVCEAAARAFHGAAELILCGPENVARPMAERLGVECLTRRRFDGPIGRASAESGRASLEALEAAIDLCRRDAADALVTAPISKEALQLAGVRDRGHTEILRRELGAGPVAMAFFEPTIPGAVARHRLRTVLVTTHVALREAIASLSVERILEVTRLFDESLRRDLGIATPRLALAALNPHASEGGLMGDEEARVLEPAVREAQRSGLPLTGPFAADSLYRRALDGEFDGVVSLYHDQGLIPMKVLGFGAAVNVTLGLSAPRTSPDHGTAFELAGRGLARSEGMLGALHTALELTRRRAAGRAAARTR